MKCTTCKNNLLSEEDFTLFECPSCTNVTIYRCNECRRRSNIYLCPQCGFEGP